MTAPDVLAYRTLEGFLKAHRAWLRTQPVGEDVAAFLERTRSSNSHLYNLASGSRPLSEALEEAFAEALGFDPHRDPTRWSWFGMLAQRSRVETPEEDRAVVRALRSAAAAAGRPEAPADAHEEAVQFSGDLLHRSFGWLFPILFALSGCPEWSDEPGWIARQILSPTTATLVGRALAALTDLRILVRGRDGVLRPQDRVVVTSQPLSAGTYRLYLRQLLGITRRLLPDSSAAVAGGAAVILIPEGHMEDAWTALAQLHRDHVTRCESVSEDGWQTVDMPLSEAHGEDAPDLVLQTRFQLLPLGAPEAPAS